MSIQRKKERSANFTTSEVHHLVALVKQHLYQNDKTANGVKKNEITRDTWEKIAHKFNARVRGTFRSAKVLKTKYKNIRNSLAKKFNEKRKARGSEKPQKNSLNETIKIEVDAPTDFLSKEESKNRYENDHFEPENDHSPFDDVLMPENLENVQMEAEEGSSIASQKKDNRTFTSSKLHSSELKELTINKTDKSCEEEILKTKIELENILREFFQKEHDLKIAHLIEKHEKEIELMEQEAQFRIDCLKAEHEARMKLIENKSNFFGNLGWLV